MQHCGNGPIRRYFSAAAGTATMCGAEKPVTPERRFQNEAGHDTTSRAASSPGPKIASLKALQNKGIALHEMCCARNEMRHRLVLTEQE
jgi:hypothetical protein